MSALTVLIAGFPLLGFLCLACAPLLIRRPLSESASAIIGVGSVALSAVAWAILATHHASPAYVHLWQWVSLPPLRVDFALYVDALTITMLGVITGVGLLIHLFAAGYMRGDDGYRRFFAYLNLFVGAMALLVMADNLVLLYLGWELVGLCSFLLIGFWYRNPENARAAGKAFLMTRIGDTALLIGIIALFWQTNTLGIQAAMAALQDPGHNDRMLAICALLLLAGAVGKSAQIPLQTWLPDAMAGPTPVSALIHAATMVTAGVYLIARCHALFQSSAMAMQTVAIIGTATLLVAGSSALVQTDIKRVLAYSTISQLGYMFAALGAGAFSAAIFHLVTHAFFKALLFLAAGATILRVRHKQSLDAMGGLARRLPFLCACFGVGCANLAALPLTAGYFSKEHLLLAIWHNQPPWLWWCALIGAAITGMYSFRIFYRIFFGPVKANDISRLPPAATRWQMGVPLVALGLLALAGGWIAPPLESIFVDAHAEPASLVVGIAGTLATLLGIALCWWFLARRPGSQALGLCREFLRQGWGFDALYQRLFVRPVLWISRVNRGDIVTQIYRGISALSLGANQFLSRAQNGTLRWYMATLLAATLLLLLVVHALARVSGP
ncbi:NADH-quinone oxidoreductase subunit L [Microbulbifer harenosus]|uniref:NADH-quinone oxidoreductase subunit L n=1 Tax=Microbulbifer harenosus TaxID=2576840 RepID=A0ABY2UMG9_9GAMM|nr:NADH-quinone oxidoreductase subunit L [Microbulbifer harenosus]TLM79673.1 NADH-quinone oxidoreductase subunit L [Microbulbifer harenosus]